MSNFVLSQSAADGLKKLLQDQGGSAGGVTGGSGRQVGVILITGEMSDETGYYPGTVTYFDAVDEDWATFANIQAVPFNEDDALLPDKRYIGIRSGDTVDGDSVWQVYGKEVSTCCGLKICEEDDFPPGCLKGDVYLDGESVFGNGLQWDSENCKVDIVPGCGITLEGGKKVGVHAGDLAGPGLIATTGCKLEVNAGDCLEIDDDGKLNVKIGGTFSAVTAITAASGCPPAFTVTTTAFSFNGCNLEQVGYNTSKVTLSCCDDCDSQPQWWCYNGACSQSQQTGATGPFTDQSTCQASCYNNPPPPPCDECNWTVELNGTVYDFEPFGGTGYIADGPGTLHFYFTPPLNCNGFYLVQLYDGAEEICNWETDSVWDGNGCTDIPQGTNNGIQFTECPSDTVTLCCEGDAQPQWYCSNGVCSQSPGGSGPYLTEAACNAACGGGGGGGCPDSSTCLQISVSAGGCASSYTKVLVWDNSLGASGAWVDGSGGPCGCDGPFVAVKCDNGSWSANWCSGGCGTTSGTVVSTSPVQVTFPIPDCPTGGGTPFSGGTMTVTQCS